MELYDIIFVLTTPCHCYALHLFFKSSADKVPIKTHLFSFYVALSVILIFGLFEQIPPFFMLVTNLILTFISSKFYHTEIAKNISNVLKVATTMLLLEAIVYAVAGYFTIELYEPNDFNSNIGLVLNRVVILLIAYIYNITMSKKKGVIQLPHKYHFAHTLVFGGMLYLYINSLTGKELSSGLFILHSCILLVTVLSFMYVEEMLYISTKMQTERAILEEQTTAVLKQKELIEQSMQTISSIRHDIKNQLFSVSALQNKNKTLEAKELTDKLLYELENIKPIAQSNHFMIDSILNFKLANQPNIKIETNLKLPDEFDFPSYDITVILGNLIDNSLTALSKLDKDKEIRISISVKQGIFFLIIENTYDGNVRISNNKFQTTKGDVTVHGLGLTNVKNVVDKYDGDLELVAKKDVFVTTVTIPLRKNLL